MLVFRNIGTQISRILADVLIVESFVYKYDNLNVDCNSVLEILERGFTVSNEFYVTAPLYIKAATVFGNTGKRITQI